MQYVMVKALTTTRRRLAVNDPVSETDDLSPHDFSDLKARGFIAEVPAEKSAEPVTPAKAKLSREPQARTDDAAGDKQ